MLNYIITFIKNSFLETNLNTMNEALERAVGAGLYFGMFILAIVYIMLELKKEDYSKVKVVFGFTSIVILILNLNPIFAQVVIKLIGSEVYWRVYWMLPVGFVLAFVFTDLIFKMPGKWKKVLAFCLVVIIIVISGSLVYNSDNFTKVSNYYKVPDSVLDIIFNVSNDDEEYKKLAGPFEFEVFTRQIDGTISLAVGRSMDGSYSKNSIIYSITNGDYENISARAKSVNCNYIVIENSVKSTEDDLTNYGFIELYENSDYTLYKLEK